MTLHPPASLPRLRRSTWACAATLAAALAAPAAQAQAVTPPDAGSTLRDLQRPPTAPRGGAASVSIPPDSDTRADPGTRFEVRAIRIEGNVAFPAETLQPLVADAIGPQATLGGLRQAARRITGFYRERGYIVARAFVPAQELGDGTVTIQVLEGTLNSSEVRNSSRVRQGVLERFVAAQELNGDVVESPRLDRTLLLLADLPSVGKVDGLLRPGQAVGTSDLLVTVGQGPSYEGDVTLDNYGNRYTGEHRLSGQLLVNSPAGLGDRLALRASFTDENLAFGRAAYDLPVGGNGLRLGAAVSSSSYQLAREFGSLDASGRVDTVGLTASYPWVRGLNRNVWLTANLDHRRLQDEVRTAAVETRKAANVLMLDGYGDWADSLGGGAYSTWRVSLTAGDLDIRTDSARVADASGLRTQGGYTKLQGQFTRLQAITPTTSAFVSANVQQAQQNLDSSEKFVLGGIYGVRAYPQGEGAGDNGWLLNLELRHNLAANVQAAVFYDAGGVELQQDPITAGDNDLTLRGWGVSLAGLVGPVQLRATLAWRDGQASATAPDRQPRLWVAAGWRF